MNIEESKINLKNLICEYKRTIQLYGDFFIGLQEIQAIETLLTAYEKEKEKNNKIDEFCRKELAFERRLQREDREPDEFNQGRFYVSENIRKIIEEE